MRLAYQTTLPLDLPKAELSTSSLQLMREGTFIDNMKLPIHRWFRYSAGFSADWVVKTINNLGLNKDSYLLDPFAGSGTSLIAAESVGINSVGLETHPFIFRIASSKLLWHENPNELLNISSAILETAQRNIAPLKLISSPLLAKCYSKANLAKLEALKAAYLDMHTSAPVWELVWLAITSILRPTSMAGTAQWQYVLPNKPKSVVIDPFDAFCARINIIAEDMLFAQSAGYKVNARIFHYDARNLDAAKFPMFDALITSPPYPNNYDYADATRLELVFWGDINGWGDLQDTIRKYLIRSCSQHSAAERLTLDSLLKEDSLKSIRSEITHVCNELAEIRFSKGGKKTYHTMIAAYFLDMSKVFQSLRPILKEKSTLCFVIGDSAPYGVYVPVEKWLGELALAAGFKGHSFEKIRDRNIKWKNRKHKVPLKEGRLWIEG